MNLVSSVVRQAFDIPLVTNGTIKYLNDREFYFNIFCNFPDFEYMCNSIIMLHIIILPGNPQQIT
jgi:hypothetical protein